MSFSRRFSNPQITLVGVFIALSVGQPDGELQSLVLAGMSERSLIALQLLQYETGSLCVESSDVFIGRETNGLVDESFT